MFLAARLIVIKALTFSQLSPRTLALALLDSHSA